MYKRKLQIEIKIIGIEMYEVFFKSVSFGETKSDRGFVKLFE